MTRVVAIMLIAVLTYAAMIGGFQPWDLALATVIAGATVFGFRTHLLRGAAPSAPTLLRRLVFVPALIGYMIRDIVLGTWQVARYSLRLRPLDHPGIVAVPMGERTRFGVTMTGFLTTVAPGTFLVDIDWDARVLLIHTIDASDPDAVRADQHAFYDRVQRHVFP